MTKTIPDAPSHSEKILSMNQEVKNRIFISLAVLAMLCLYLVGFNTQMGLNELRSSALSRCIDGKYELFDFCLNKTNGEYSPSLAQFVTPFIPVALMLWVQWLLKIDATIEVVLYPKRTLKFLRFVAYTVAMIGIALPLLMVLEKSADRIYEVHMSNLFIGPWLASAWVSAPLVFQKLVGPRDLDIEFSLLRKVLFAVLISPVVAVLLQLGRELTNI